MPLSLCVYVRPCTGLSFPHSVSCAKDPFRNTTAPAARLRTHATSLLSRKTARRNRGGRGARGRNGSRYAQLASHIIQTTRDDE